MIIRARPEQRLRAACFDLDGTLVDSGPLHLQAERAALAALGFPELAPDHPITFGAGIMPGMQMLAGHYGLPSAQHVFDAYLPAWEAAFESGLQRMAGADAALQLLTAREIPLALVTSGENEYVDRVLSMFGWTDVFAHRVTLESVTRVKPDPEPYIEAARLLGWEPAELAGIEDSLSGLQSVMSAGCYSVLVGSPPTVPTASAPTDLHLQSLDELDCEMADLLFVA